MSSLGLWLSSTRGSMVSVLKTAVSGGLDPITGFEMGCAPYDICWRNWGRVRWVRGSALAAGEGPSVSTHVPDVGRVNFCIFPKSDVSLSVFG